MIEIKNIFKSFNGNEILKDVSLNIEKGKITSVIGESGSGKTTLIRIITGLEKCDKGTIKIEDDYLCTNGEYCNDKCCDFNVMKKIKKNIGLVFQNFNLFPHMSVLENIIEGPMSVLKIDKKLATEEAKYILSSLGMEDKKDNYPCELSGGQKQRVAIARALILKPKYICFDEPTSALDPKSVKDVYKIIKNLVKDDIGAVIITHDINFANKISDNIIELKDGIIKK